MVEAHRKSLVELDKSELEAMKDTPKICRVIGVIWILCALVTNGILWSRSWLRPEMQVSSEDAVYRSLLAGLTAGMGILGLGMSFRARWVRYPAIVLCCIHLIGFPAGTLLGVWGLVALLRGRRMFGPDRPDVAEVQAELLRRRNEQGAEADGT